MSRRSVVGAKSATCVKGTAAVVRVGGLPCVKWLRYQALASAVGHAADALCALVHQAVAASHQFARAADHATVPARQLALPSDMEPLEDRRLLSSVTFTGGVLRIVGDSSSSNRMSAWYSSGSNSVKGWTGKDGEIIAAPMSQLKSIELVGGSGDDRYYVDPLVKVPVSIAKNGGNDTLVGGNSDLTFVSSSDPAPAPAPEPTPAPAPEPQQPPLSGGDSSGDLIGGNEYSDDTGQTGAPVAVIDASSTSGMAGHTVHVNGLGSNLRAGNPLTARYEWDFGDDGSEFNQLVGFNAAHTYDKPGTYTITLFVTNESGKTASARKVVTIGSDTRRTIYVDRQGSDRNDGSSPSEAVQSVSRVEQLLGDDTRVLFQRGDTWDLSSGLTIPDDNVIVGAYGSGSRPVLKWTGSSISDIVGLSSTNSKNVIIQDLAFDSGSTRGNAVHVRGENITIRRNEFLHVYDAVNNNSQPNGVLVQDNSAPLTNGVRSYFAWVAGTDHVYLGNTVRNVSEHVIRMNQYSRVLISGNDLTNDTSAGDMAKATVSAQRGDYTYVANNHLADGGLGVGPLGNGDGFQDSDYANARAAWAVLEGNRIDDTGIAVTHGSEHVAIRNNVIARNDDSIFTIDGYNSSYHRGVSDVSIVNNTAVNNDSDGKFLNLLGSASGLVLKNNLYVAPNMMTGLNRNAVVYVNGSNLNSFKEISHNVWEDVKKHWYADGGVFYVWPSWSDRRGYLTPQEWDAYAVVSDDTVEDVTLNSAFAPSSSSAASGAADRFAGVFTDINGKVRPTSGAWTAGAVQI